MTEQFDPQLQAAVDAFNNGQIIAYPTEAVFGLGCDPDNEQAINKLLAIKQRDPQKGLILIASNYSQLLPYIDDDKLPQDLKFTVLSRWPGPITQVLPAKQDISNLLTGSFDTIAVRITEQPDVVALCNAVNRPIISTSANLSGDEPARVWQELEAKLGDKVEHTIKGETLGYTNPSTIINALTGEVYRA